MGIAAGWYEDGVSVGVERWFDGAAWTEQTRPLGAVAYAPVPGYAAPSGYASPTGYAAPQGYAQAPGYVSPPGYGAQLGPGYAAGPDLGPGSALHWLVPVGRSWQSILAGYLGIVGLFLWVLGPVAVGFGVWGWRVARNGGHGMGRAVFAIVAGLAGTIFGLIFLASYLGTQ